MKKKKKRVYTHKFTKKQIVSLREEYLEGATQDSLAEKYGMSKKMVYLILYLKKYKHIPIHLEEAEYMDALHMRSFNKRSL